MEPERAIEIVQSLAGGVDPFSGERFASDSSYQQADTDATGAVLRSYTYGPGIDNLLAITVHGATETNTYYALTDHLGTIHALADDTGAVAEAYRYDAFGNVLGVFDGNGRPLLGSALGNRFLFHGREYSWTTGLYNFRARWYDPTTGRWLSNDPIGISGGLNQYVAFDNNPVNFVDPLGLLTREQYNDLVQILEMERQLGTHETARRISNSFEHQHHRPLLKRFNADEGGNSRINGVDIDWFTDLASRSEVRFPGFVTSQYIVAKSFWSIYRRVIGKPNGYPWPFQDPGERVAVRKVELGRRYSDIITSDYLAKQIISDSSQESECEK
ncbi:MAG: hypothetical protein K9N51_10995 [Candidatus Pacebacteria bacterium]|nr:hypothetical protein [Candidatus Paceibacterota bacterium]